MFAKLYESALYGQILVKRDNSNEKCDPEVRFYFKPPGLGLCSTALTFNDNDEGNGKADELFERVTLEKAEETVGNLIAEFETMVGRDEGN